MKKEKNMIKYLEYVTPPPPAQIREKVYHTQTKTCLWGVEQHTAQFIAGVGLNVRVAQTTHLVPHSQLEMLLKEN